VCFSVDEGRALSFLISDQFLSKGDEFVLKVHRLGVTLVETRRSYLRCRFKHMLLVFSLRSI